VLLAIGRHGSLTRAGVELGITQPAVSQWLADIDAVRAGGTGRVRVGTMQVGGAAIVPAVAMRLHREAPGIELSLQEDVTAGLWAGFERNELDLLVTRLDARALESGLPQRVLFVDRHRVVSGPHHPLARCRRPGWADAARFPWVLPPPGTPLDQALCLLSSVIAARLQSQGLAVGLPLVLSPDVGNVGLLWRETTPGPALATVLQAFEAECPVERGARG
jgi:DNA-binding transcriptional LysR family regulator